jgi:hypothetical protein
MEHDRSSGLLAENEDHTFDLSNVERTWLDRSGWCHAICSCGVHLSAESSRLLGIEIARHVEEA